MPRGLRVLAAPVVLLALVTECDLVGGGEPDAPPSSTDWTGEPTSGPTERPTALETDIRECAGDGAQPLAGWDVEAPEGFVEVGGYLQYAPIEGDHEARYFDLTPHGFPDVLGVAYYPQLDQGPVTDACEQLDEDAALDRIASQLRSSDEVMLEDPVSVDLAGVPGYEVLGEHSSGRMLLNYFVYGHDELLHIECQWQAHEEAIRQGCTDLLASLTW